MRNTIILTMLFLLTSCTDGHDGPSHSLKMELKRTEVSCQDLEEFKFSKGYWVKSELDGWGLLVITKNNEPNTYALSLMAHGQERAIETREIECNEL